MVSAGGSILVDADGYGVGDFPDLSVDGTLELGEDSKLIVNAADLDANGSLKGVLHYAERTGDFAEVIVVDGPDGLTASAVYDDVAGRVDLVVVGFNEAPVASGGLDQVVEEGQLVTLDATATTDIGGDALSYNWVQTGGPAVTLSDASATTPSFEAPEGLVNTAITFELQVSDGEFHSTDSVIITVEADNDAPSAEAGPLQSVTEGDIVTLAGSGTDPEGQALTYNWVQTGGPSVVLSDADAATPTFEVPDGSIDSDITFELHVSDGTNESVDTVTIAVDFELFTLAADAGSDQSVEEGDQVTLLGGSNVAVDAESITFNAPEIESYGGSGQDISLVAEVLEDGDTLHLSGNGWKSIDFDYEVTPNTVLSFDFRTDSLGEIHGIGFDSDSSIGADKTFQLAGSQSWGMEVESYASADGEWQHFEINVGESYTGDFDRLFFVNDHDAGSQNGESFFSNVSVYESDASSATYSWTQVSGPSVTLDDASAKAPSFDAPEGVSNSDIVFELTVTEGDDTSTDQITITVNADNDAPTAEAGPPQSVTEGDTISLAGSASDPEGQSLTYSWVQTGGPEVVLSDASAAAPSFEVPVGSVDSDITFELHVSDGTNESVDTVTIAVDQAAFSLEAEAGADQVVEEGDPVTLSAGSNAGVATESVSFQEADVESYGGGGQDISATVEILDDGDTLHLSGNGWKSIDFDYEVTPNTVLSFDFRTDSLGEIHGIGFDSDASIGQGHTFQLAGSQSWGLDVDSYTSADGEWQHFEINVGESYTGDFDRMFFVNDHDAGARDGESFFSNISVYESDAAPAATYSWTQISGPVVTLDDASAETPTFDAPEGVSNSDIVFELTVSDGDSTSTDQVTITVNADNDAPAAEAGPAQAVAEGDVVTLAGSGTDPEGQSLTYSWVQTSGPTVVLSDASAAAPTFDAPEGLVNSDISFALTVSDGTNESMDTVTVAVAADNDAPAAEAGPAQAVAEGDVVTLAGSGTDPEGQSLTYSWVQTSGPTVVLSDASAAAPTFDAPEGLVNSDISFALTVSDGTNESMDTVTVAVAADNDAPAAEAGPAQAVAEGDVVTLAGSGTDPEGQSLTYSWVQTSGPTVILSDASAAAPTFDAPEGLVNSDISFALTVSDGTNESMDTVTVAVAADNDAPAAEAGPAQAVAEGDVVTLAGSGTDPEGQSLTYSWVQTSGPTVILSDASAAAPTFDAPEGLVNSDISFALTVSDGTNESMDTVTVAVAADNDAPAAEAGPAQAVAEGDVVTLAGSGTDPEGQSLTYSWVQTSGPTVVLSDANAAAPTFDAPEGLVNSDISFALTVSDGTNESMDTVTVAVAADNDAPAAEAGPAQAVAEGDVVTLAGSGTDPEGQSLTYSWVQTSGPTVVLSDASAAAPTFDAPEGLVNSDISFALTVSDGTNESMDTVTVAVAADNDAPAAEAGPAQAVAEGDVVTLAGSGTDPEGQSLTYSWVQTSGPTVVLSDANAAAPTFDAPEGLVNSDISFALTVSDGTNESMDTVTVAVAADNDAPAAEAGPAQAVAEGDVVTLAGSGTDQEGQSLTYRWVQTSGPAVVLSDATAQAPTFEAPEEVANTNITFELHVSDGTNESVDSVTVEVEANNDAPRANAGQVQSVEVGDTVSLFGSGIDPENRDLSYEWVQVSGPQVSLSDPNSPDPSFKVPEGFEADDLVFELRVSDGENMSVDTVEIMVREDASLGSDPEQPKTEQSEEPRLVDAEEQEQAREAEQDKELEATEAVAPSGSERPDLSPLFNDVIESPGVNRGDSGFIELSEVEGLGGFEENFAPSEIVGERGAFVSPAEFDAALADGNVNQVSEAVDRDPDAEAASDDVKPKGFMANLFGLFRGVAGLSKQNEVTTPKDNGKGREKRLGRVSSSGIKSINFKLIS